MLKQQFNWHFVRHGMVPMKYLVLQFPGPHYCRFLPGWSIASNRNSGAGDNGNCQTNPLCSDFQKVWFRRCNFSNFSWNGAFDGFWCCYVLLCVAFVMSAVKKCIILMPLRTFRTPNVVLHLYSSCSEVWRMLWCWSLWRKCPKGLQRSVP